MKRLALLMAMIVEAALLLCLSALPVVASDTHLQIQNQAVTRSRPGIKEQCVYFDPGSVQLAYFIDRRSVDLVAAPLRTLSTFDSRDEAVRSMGIIKQFGINELCVAANAKLSYMLVSGKAARGKVPGGEHVTFDPYLLRVEKLGGEWRVAKGKNALLSFGSDVGAAREALRVIVYYGFNAKCSVGSDKGKGFVFLYAVPQPERLQKKPYLEAKATPKP